MKKIKINKCLDCPYFEIDPNGFKYRHLWGKFVCFGNTDNPQVVDDANHIPQWCHLEDSAD
jgi:hypothetical protein